MKKIFAIPALLLITHSMLAQNVGIGTTTPLTKLDVNGNSSIRNGLEVKANPLSLAYDPVYAINYFSGGALTLGNNISNTFRYLKIDGSNFQSYQKDENDTPASFVFNPYGGNIGIGGVSPTARLHIFADKALQLSHNTNPYMTLTDIAGEEYGYIMAKNSATNNTILNGGFRGLEIGTPNTGAGNKGIVFTTSWSQRMYITPGGSIGIATLTPTAKLHVNGNVLAGVSTGWPAQLVVGAMSDQHTAISAYSSRTDGYAVRGESPGYGVYGKSSATQQNATTSAAIYGIQISPDYGWAGKFEGYVSVSKSIIADNHISAYGNLYISGSKNFKIDHPLDPENKYLVHSCVESDEMANMYNGTITTDANGFATVQLPRWFEAENENFKYQLTCIGQFAQAIVKEKISNNRFIIQTDKPLVEISWQVVGNRKDVYAKRSGFKVEVEKNAEEKGRYLNATYYGRPAEESIINLQRASTRQ